MARRQQRGAVPTKFGTGSRANVATSNPEQTRQCQVYALSTRIPKTPGRSGILIHEPDVLSVREQILTPLDTTTTIDTPTSILTDHHSTQDTETDTTTITDTPTLLTISLSLSTPDDSSTPPTITSSTKRTPFTITPLININTPTISAISDPAITSDDHLHQPATSIIPEGHCRSTWAPWPSTIGLQSMEY